MPMRISARFFISSTRFFCAAVIWNFGSGSATSGDVRHAEDRLGGDFDEVRIGLLDLVEVALDAAHLFDVFDRALFAGGDDQALRAGFQRNLGLDRRLVVGCRRSLVLTSMKVRRHLFLQK